MSSHDLDALLQEREKLTKEIYDDCYNIDLYSRRCDIHKALGYPDLAAMDAYKALLLVDEVSDEGFEYHEQAMDSLLRTRFTESKHSSHETVSLVCATLRKQFALELADDLTVIGCLRAAYEYVQQVLRSDRQEPAALEMLKRIKAQNHDRNPSLSPGNDPEEISMQDLSEQGHVRREVYPWNKHEADRTTEQAIALLNEELAAAAPHLEVKVMELPLLHDPMYSTPETNSRMIRQLGLYAKKDILPGEEILRERSLLTANARLHEPLCDACNAVLPDLSALASQSSTETEDGGPIPCPDCDDIVFCNKTCFDLAQESYHPAVCGTDLEVQKDVPAAKAADTLYTLLLSRALAMSQAQDVHPLDLKEVKYIWGDFSLPPSSPLDDLTGQDLFAAYPRTLPFTFEHNILAPLHMLEKMDVNIFTNENDIADLSVWNTLYSKFRGTASARISPRDGRPEVAAVHPLWCLANHSCDPNVSWEWGGEITFEARSERAHWKRRDGDGRVVEEREGKAGGIGKGGEILNHYVDIDLPVQARREWGSGALGGFCRCERCMWEELDGGRTAEEAIKES